jgi:hypothetical protein
MLKLKIYANENMQMPERICEADNTIKLLDPYLLESPMTNIYKGIYGRLRRAARYMGIPMWGVLRNKAFQSSAYLADQIVKLGLGEWLYFDSDLFDPKKAISRERGTHNPGGPLQESAKAKLSAAHKLRCQNMTEEEKAERSRRYREGWRKRRERLEAKKKAAEQNAYQQKLIASGRAPASQDEIPEWFKM